MASEQGVCPSSMIGNLHRFATNRVLFASWDPMKGPPSRASDGSPGAHGLTPLVTSLRTGQPPAKYTRPSRSGVLTRSGRRRSLGCRLPIHPRGARSARSGVGLTVVDSNRYTPLHSHRMPGVIDQETPRSNRDAEAEIEAHVRGLFDAFLAKDTDAIRKGHRADWTGFQIPSKRIIRGIDEYMEAAHELLASLRAVRYEFLEMDIQVDGDVALVYYVARDWLANDEGETTVLIRALDVYRLEQGSWNQAGSNICVLADD